MTRYLPLILLAFAGCSPAATTPQTSTGPPGTNGNPDEVTSGDGEVGRYCVVLLGEARIPMRIGVIGSQVFIDKNLDGVLKANEAVKAATAADAMAVSCEVQQPDGDGRIWKCRLLFGNWPAYRQTFDFDQLTPTIVVQLPDGRHFGAWGDERGKLPFARNPREAPKLQMGACKRMPLTMGFEIRPPLVPKEDGMLEINAAVGIRNPLPGTFAWLAYNSIPPGVWPDAEVDFADGKKTVTVKASLSHRC